ncbi:MAG: hypothetical protein RXQ93_02820 [Caldisphaera sp.]
MGNDSTKIVLIAIVLVFVFSLALYAYTFRNFPPVPNEVISQNGTVIFTKQQIIMGKYYFQKYGLMDYGSIEGMGSYFGIDFTGYTMRLLQDYTAKQLYLDPLSQNNMPSVYNSIELNDIKNYLDPLYFKKNNTIVVSNEFAEAYGYVINYYSIYLGKNSSQYRLKPDLINNNTVIQDLAAYFTWSALISIMVYTNGFPYTIGLTTPNNNVYFSTFAMVGAIFAVGIPLIIYIIRELISHWNDPVVKIDLQMKASPFEMGMDRKAYKGYFLISYLVISSGKT